MNDARRIRVPGEPDSPRQSAFAPRNRGEKVAARPEVGSAIEWQLKTPHTLCAEPLPGLRASPRVLAVGRWRSLMGDVPEWRVRKLHRSG